VPRLRVHVSVFWSHAKSRAVLGGTLGENAACCSGHDSSAQEDGCGLSPAAGPARHVVTVVRSPERLQQPSVEAKCFASSHFFHEPSFNSEPKRYSVGRHPDILRRVVWWCVEDGVRSRPGAARTILLSHIISDRPSKQPLLVLTFLKVYMELGSYFLFLQEQIKDIIKLE
jgi:hypothetical protein